MSHTSPYGDHPTSATEQVSSETQASHAVTQHTYVETAPANGAPSRSRQNSADRKRRHTGSEHERRPFYPYTAVMDENVGADPTVQLVSTASIRATHQGTDSAPDTGRRLPAPPGYYPRHLSGEPNNPNYNHNNTLLESLVASRIPDITPPRWQPDVEVSKCPICGVEFTFWYRKHHCRKCGRVVCSACSPHRITIPRQYIVQPPSAYLGLEDDQEGDEEDDALFSFSDHVLNSALGGREVVRVCNPCVPDPWSPGTSSAQGHTTSIADSRLGRHLDFGMEQDRLASGATGSPQAQWLDPQRGVSARHRSYSHQPPAFNPDGHDYLSNSSDPLSRNPGPSPMHIGQRHVPRHGTHRYSQSTDNRPLSALPGGRRDVSRVPFARPIPVPPPVVPRREVKEEDECPVCGREMPVGDSIREAHIQDCIASRFSSTPSQRVPLPEHNASTPPSVGQMDPGASFNSPAGPSAPNVLRARASSYRSRGMAVYRATEKDCAGEDGHPEECVICFEEFEPGDELGRMECLCKFHRSCIRQWWETKGVGSCPTHQLHD